MLAITTDRRAIEAAPDFETERLAAAAAEAYLDVRLRLARLLLRIERRGTFHLSACSSIVQYAVGLGVPAAEARMLVDLGRALEAPVPEPPATDGGACAPGRTESVEERIRSGRMHVENAALVGRLLAQPESVRPGEDWMAKAEALRAPELRQQVRQRLEETAQGAATLVAVTVHITERTREEFHRARVLASREAATSLTEGQTFTRVVRFFLDARDERRRGAGPRRVGPTGASPGERYVPSEVRREVIARSGDRCEVPGCALDTFLEVAHVEPHADGGNREAENLLRLCHVHHTQFDADCLLFGGWRDRRPVFRTAHGEEITGRTAPNARPRERVDAFVDAVVARRTHASQVSERPPPVWVRSG